MAKTATTPSAKDHLKSQHEATLHDVARQSGLGDTLLAVEKLKEVNADVLRATRGIGLQLVFGLGTFTLLALSGLGLWFVGLMAINALSAGFVIKAMLFMGLNLFMLVSAAGALTYSLLRTPRAVPTKPVQRAAQRLVDLLDVPIVSFGHTHEEVVSRLRRPGGARAWYYNTGTWIAVFTHDVLLPRERVQYTFLRVHNMEPELLHWSPGRGEPLQVILLDETSYEGWGAVQAPHAAAPPREADTDATPSAVKRKAS